MIYELRSNGEESRIFPDEASEPEWAWREEKPSSYPRLLGAKEAHSWLSAKKAFGFELTPLQARILEGTITHFELYGRHGPVDELEALFKPRGYHGIS